MEDDWQEKVKGILKAELKRRGLGYRELAERPSRNWSFQWPGVECTLTA